VDSKGFSYHAPHRKLKLRRGGKLREAALQPRYFTTEAANAAVEACNRACVGSINRQLAPGSSAGHLEKHSMKFATLAALAAVMAVPAFAQPPQRSPEELEAAFTKGDADKDGKLTAAEFKETLPEQFKSQVTDEMLPQILARRDADKDGFISKAEFSAPMQRRAQ
jgi:hypothetical protein